jgi:TRAP-type C4-dicarboxylate transport system permease small subunit
MRYFMAFVHRIDLSFHIIAGLTLAFMMVVTFTDVVIRIFGRPIVGTMEIISFCGAVVIGFAIPYASWMKVHVFVDLLTAKVSPRSQVILKAFTKSIGLLFFVFVSYNFIRYGLTLMKTGEVSPSFKIPYYPITFGLAVSCFLESLTLLCDLLRLAKGGNNG